MKKNHKTPAALIILFFLVTGCASVQTSLHHDRESGEIYLNHTPSLSYRVAKLGVRVLGFKQTFRHTPEKVVSRSNRINTILRQSPPAGFYLRYNVSKTMIQDRPCFFISPKKNIRTDKAVIFFYGGSLTVGIQFFHWGAVERILKGLSVPVCVPLYPLYPETDPFRYMSFMDDVFSHTYEMYPDAQVTGLGDSSGAYLLLSYCHYLTETNAPRFPSKLICVSPAQLVGIDEETLSQMRSLRNLDVAISIDILDTLPVLLNLSGSNLDYFSAPLYGDFSRFPPITVFSGTHDIFYPLVQPFVRRVRSHGCEIELYTGIGMMHEWPYLPISPESKYAMNKILEVINTDLCEERQMAIR